MPIPEKYAEFARSLDSVEEREEKTQLVFSVSSRNFCWVAKNGTSVQLFPALGKAANPTRILRRSGDSTVCIRSSNGQVDARYDDPKGILRPLWSYVGFRPDDCSSDYGFNLIKQGYEQASGQKCNVLESDSRSPTTASKPKAQPIPAATSEPIALEVLTKEIVLKLEDILRDLEPEAGRKLSEWISDLQRKNLIPRPVADMMHTIRTIRNSVLHTNYRFSNHDRTVLEAAWLSVKEWWRQRQSG